MRFQRWIGPPIVVALIISAVVGANVAVTLPASAASTTTNATAAVRYASARGYRTSIAVIDTTTGAFSGAGDYDRTYASESVVKTMIATRLILTGQMSGWTQTTAYKMITQSDDASANALYGRAGGDGVITWIKQTFNIPGLGSPPPRPGWWGGTQITAHGLTIFYNAIRHNPAVWAWLGNAMHHATAYGSDGTYQFFGIPSATTGAAVKQGWGADNPAGQPAFNSTGFVNADRYAVAILTQGGTYGAPIAAMLTAEARLLMPGGQMQRTDPFGHLDALRVSGYSATVAGWALDPDAPNTAILVAAYVNGIGEYYGASGVPRPDVNRVYGVAGAHGYAIHLVLRPGVNSICTYGINVGPGTNATLGCRSVTVNPNPFGSLDAVAVSWYTATAAGWALDPDAPATAIKVAAYVNGIGQYYGASGRLRQDVNRVYAVTGAHGYAIPLKLAPGVNRICTYGINVGAGSNALLACRSVTVNPNPFGFLDTVSVSGHSAVVAGWTIDPDAPDTALTVSAYVNGRIQYYGASGVNRPDVDAAYHVTGAHGYSIALKLTSGANTVCTYAINVGAGTNANLACRVVTVA